MAELTPSFGSSLLLPDPALLLSGGLARPGVWVMGIPLTLVSLACGWAQEWLVFGRREWRLEPRVLVLQRRFVHRLRTPGEAQALELVKLVASDECPILPVADHQSRRGAAARS